jgi:hypothetical protein
MVKNEDEPLSKSALLTTQSRLQVLSPALMIVNIFFVFYPLIFFKYSAFEALNSGLWRLVQAFSVAKETALCMRAKGQSRSSNVNRALPRASRNCVYTQKIFFV